MYIPITSSPSNREIAVETGGIEGETRNLPNPGDTFVGPGPVGAADGRSHAARPLAGIDALGSPEHPRPTRQHDYRSAD
jgi:hypothetical protein